jgi:hypothetical protein
VAALRVELLGLVLFLPFLACLHEVLRRAEGDHHWLSTAVLAGGLVGMAVKLSGIGSAWVAMEGGLDASIQGAFQQVNDAAFIVAMLPLAVMMGAVAAATLRTRVLPAWLGWLAALAAPALLVNGTMVGASFGPAFLVHLLWVLLASVALAIRPNVTTPRAEPVPARP